MVNNKTNRKTYAHDSLHDVALIDLIKSIFNRFGFGETNNKPYNIYINNKKNSTDGDYDGDGSMIPAKLYKIDKLSPSDICKLLSISCPVYTQKL